MSTRWRSRPGAERRPDSPPGAGAYLGPRAASRSAQRRGRRPRGWTQAAERLRRSAHPKETPDRGGWNCPRLGMGWGASSLFLGPPCRASSLACEAPPANTPHAHPAPARPGPAALRLPGGLEPSRSPSELEAAGRPLSRRLRSGAMGLVSLRARRTALPAEGPSKVWGEGTGGTQDASRLEVPRGAFPQLTSPYSVSKVEGGVGQDAHSAATTPRPGELCKASPPGSCPRRPGSQMLGRLCVCAVPVGSGGD